MRVAISFESNINEDGYDEVVAFSRYGVETIHDLLNLYADAAKAGGFQFVDRVGYATDKGEMVWSEF